jgi:hypothetical protein
LIDDFYQGGATSAFSGATIANADFAFLGIFAFGDN